MAPIQLRAHHWFVCGSLNYTQGVRGAKWRSGVRKDAYSASPPITSRAVRKPDRRSLSFSNPFSNHAWESGARRSSTEKPVKGPVHVHPAAMTVFHD